ncbi:MAG: hypothetical protein ACEQSX_16745, partial [Baekduiaceae bacterium]
MQPRPSDPAILTERLRGRTLRDIAADTGLTPEGVRFVVAREGRRQIDDIVLRLMVARRTGDLYALAVPDHGGPDFDLAMSYVQWVVGELTERGVKVAAPDRPP